MRRACAALAAGLLLVAPAFAEREDAPVTAVALPSFNGTPIGERTQGLIYKGGLQLSSVHGDFGGHSGIGFTGPDGRLTMVSDRGTFVSGQLIYDEAGAPLSLVGVTVEPIRNSAGAELPTAFSRDAEAMAVVIRDGVPAAVRVGFENLTRVADFDLENSIPVGPAREVPVPAWLSAARTNESLEAVCIAPPASPVAGSTLLLTEGVFAADGSLRAHLLGSRDRGDLTYRAGPGTVPTDCAFLPDGDLLVLERGIALLSFSMKVKRVKAADVRAGAQMRGEIIFEGIGGDIDNMEGIATRTLPDGEVRVTIVSDNNFLNWQRNLLLEFTLAE